MVDFKIKSFRLSRCSVDPVADMNVPAARIAMIGFRIIRKLSYRQLVRQFDTHENNRVLVMIVTLVFPFDTIPAEY